MTLSLFEIESRTYRLPDELATMLAENLLRLSADADRSERDGMRALARSIEQSLVDEHADTLTTSADESALELFHAIRRALQEA